MLQLIINKTTVMNDPVSVVSLDKKEIKKTTVDYLFYETDYGSTLIASTSLGICYVGFGEREAVLNDLERRYSGANIRERKAALHELALRFIKNEKVSELPLHISGTPFQMEVWKALLQIPAGKLSTYREIAEAVNNPKALRAVGSAVGSNPVSFIVPCHRVVRSDGRLGGYFWGAGLKKRMLEKEIGSSDF